MQALNDRCMKSHNALVCPFVAKESVNNAGVAAAYEIRKGWRASQPMPRI
jgi:hypothetical protein